jgi:hypothetical protein
LLRTPSSKMNFSAADVVAKAVDPFFTTKPVGEGTGLGLSMIYGFARQTRGHHELPCAFRNHDRVRLCNALQASGKVRRLPTMACS